jgi:hypothetical protein
LNLRGIPRVRRVIPTDSGRTTDDVLEGFVAEQIICGPP